MDLVIFVLLSFGLLDLGGSALRDPQYKPVLPECARGLAGSGNDSAETRNPAAPGEHWFASFTCLKQSGNQTLIWRHSPRTAEFWKLKQNQAMLPQKCDTHTVGELTTVSGQLGAGPRFSLSSLHIQTLDLKLT
ncbi:hypothetical protein ACXYTJ_12470 [Gilvimarinus sp. F26214L]|uniref:hypothetical protein n=1 Tax=Gilvimarinus sp. DZF01 TaxID=3461371 RepID=UPI004045774E